eukprot:TRINITY_DN11955_c0_g1_i2.p1 TRINITY_DN11955_c0_g1~~TRINITY_DN11955_c0_g1_i2.p1  ORF type:complete len:346 (+),score=48.90 TRINITY_DN11955_c0_g1_i2:339-1376(+)
MTQVQSQRNKLHTVQMLGTMILVAVLPVGLFQGAWAFASLMSLLISLTTVQVAVRAALHNGVPYPYSLTALHMLLTVVTSFLAGPRLQEKELRLALRTFPVSLAGGLAVILHNVALTQANVSFVTMLASCTPVLTYIVEVVGGRREASLKWSLSVILACIGGTLCVQGQSGGVSRLALILVITGCLCRSLKSVFQEVLLNAADVSPARLAAWGGAWTFLLTLPFVVCYEGAGAFHVVQVAPASSLMAVLASCAAAVMLNISQWSSLQYLGPVQQHMFGNLQLVFVLILASLWLGEDCSTQQLAGTLTLVASVLLAKVLPSPYSQESIRIKRAPHMSYASLSATDA